MYGTYDLFTWGSSFCREIFNMNLEINIIYNIIYICLLHVFIMNLEINL